MKKKRYSVEQIITAVPIVPWNQVIGYAPDFLGSTPHEGERTSH